MSKKTIKYILYIGLGITLIGLIGSLLTFSAYFTNGVSNLESFSIYKSNNANMEAVITSSDITETFNNINISGSDVNVEVDYSNDGTSNITLGHRFFKNASKPNYDLNSEVINDTLTITVAKNRQFNNFFWSDDINLKVSIPKKDYDRLDIYTNDGSIRVENFKFNQGDFKAHDGSLNFKNISANSIVGQTRDGSIKFSDVTTLSTNVTSSDGSISLDNVTGDITSGAKDGNLNFRDINAGSIVAQTADGNINFTDITASVTNVTSSDGSIVLNNVTGDISGDSKDGSIKVQLSEIKNNINLTASDGSIRLNTRKNPTDVRFVTNARDGSIHLPDSFHNEQGSLTVTLQTNDGSINVSN